MNKAQEISEELVKLTKSKRNELIKQILMYKYEIDIEQADEYYLAHLVHIDT